MADGPAESENTLSDLADSFLHRIAAHEKILLYNDMVKWVVKGITITDRTLFTSDGRIFESFKPKDLKKMYHLPEPQKCYKKSFLEAFAKENEVESDPIKKWRHFHKKQKHESSSMYYVDSLASPYCYAATMMCRLFGSPNSTKFSIEMVPLIEAALKSYGMDWATIISDKMDVQILDYRKNRFVTTRVVPPFYMSAYIVDTICFNSDFPMMGWKWTVKDPTPIHIYHKDLWKKQYKKHFYKIFHGFILPILHTIFNRPTPRLSKEASIYLTSIGNWF